MRKYFYFRGVTDEDHDDDVSASITIPVEDIAGLLPTTVTNLDLYYKTDDKTVPNTTGGTATSGTGKVSMTVTRGKMREVLASIASHANFTKPTNGGNIIMVDDVVTGYDGEATLQNRYFHPDVTACVLTVA